MKKMLALTAVIALFAFSAPAMAAHGGKHILVTVNGLVCDFCAQSMKKVLGKQDAVSAVDVNLTSKIITIDLKQTGDLSDETLTKAVTDAGYEVVKIHRE